MLVNAGMTESDGCVCCVLRVACCVLRVACCVLRVACCVLRVACCAGWTRGGAM